MHTVINRASSATAKISPRRHPCREKIMKAYNIMQEQSFDVKFSSNVHRLTQNSYLSISGSSLQRNSSTMISGTILTMYSNFPTAL